MPRQQKGGHGDTATNAVLSVTPAGVRHGHSGESSMVKQRAERIQGLKRAVGEVERVVRELGGEECEEEETGDGRIEYDEDRWNFTVRGDCWVEKENGEIRVWIEIREVGEVRKVNNREMLLCKEGNTKEDMTESLMGIREGRWPVGNWEGGKDTDVQGSGHAHVCERESGTCEGETDTTTAQVCGAGAESYEKGSESSGGTRGIMCGAQHELWTDGDKLRKVRKGRMAEGMDAGSREGGGRSR